MVGLSPGERVVARDRLWRVATVRALSAERAALELDALDGEEPRRVELLAPPDLVVSAPPEGLELEARSFDSFASWAAAHWILAAGLVRETGVVTGARFGRVALEAYQLAPVLRILGKPRPSLLIADDVGLGKTIEAGLILLELMARGRAKRVLVVAPPGLLDQWDGELALRFGFEFALLDNAAGVAKAQTDLPAGVNPWDALPRVLTSLDFLKRETVRRRALRKRWDLVIVDEAHALAESGTPTNPYRTQRHRLGRDLRDSSRGLVLLTATPHNGYRHSFRSLLELVDPTVATFAGDPADVQRRVERACIRRMKRQLVRPGEVGRADHLFPPRSVRGVPVHNEGGYHELLHLVGRYCARTAKAARGSEDEDLVSFAMQIVRKRSLSSRRALETTVSRRLDALRKEAARESPPDRAELRDLQAALPLSDAAAERTAERLVRSAIPKEETRRRAEVRALQSIRKLLRSLPDGDPKIEEAMSEIRRVLGDDSDEKVIVFTEYLDTLSALEERLSIEPDLADCYVVIRGGLTRRQRLRRQARFEGLDIRILLATDAASEGLNLQRYCRRVLHVELPWNPNRLEQRNGRVDRYGQTRSPEIRYLFYADSPEEKVLAQIVDKVERMQSDRISTPDVLGVWMGDGSFERELTELEGEGDALADRIAHLVRTFEDRTAEFVREVQPLLAPLGGEAREMERILAQLASADPLPADGEGLETAVRATLGEAALTTSPVAGCWRIEVPLAYRGPGVRATYRAATFDRNLAARQDPEVVELITPAHPLVAALQAAAKRRFLHVYPEVRGIPPRRLAVRRAPDEEEASTIYTFLARITGGGDLVEEHLLALRVDADGRALGDPLANLHWLDTTEPGEAEVGELLARFGDTFAAAREAAAFEARAWTEARAQALAAHRRAQASTLRRELEIDLSDRLAEIGVEEARARAVSDTSGQQLLFARGEVRQSFEARRKAAEAQADARRAEIDEYERVGEPSPPRLLGALFLLPETAQ